MPLLIATGVGAGISALSGGVKMFKGKKQEEAGKKARAGLIKPQYQIPEEIKQNLKESELRALEGLPTAQKAQYVKDIERGQERALQAQADRKGGLMGIQAATQQATDAFTSLTSMDAQARAANQQQLQQNRMIMAQEKGKQYAERRDDYQQDLDSANAMIGAGQQNFMGGLDTIGATALTAGTAMLGSGIGGGAGAAAKAGKVASSAMPTASQFNAANTLTKSVGNYGYLLGGQ